MKALVNVVTDLKLVMLCIAVSQTIALAATR